MLQDTQDEDPSLVDIRITNAMQTSPIIETIFRFLHLEDIKHCRYVCHSWNAIAEPLLRKRSKIMFRFDAGKNLKTFFEAFCNSESDLKFTSFSFSDGSCDVTEMKEFLQQQKTSIQALEFKNVVVIENGDAKQNPCINNWISDIPIKKLTIVYTKKWDIHRYLMVSFDALPYAEEINLHECKVLVRQEEKKSVPTKVKLTGVVFCRDGNNNEFIFNDVINEILINSVIDLKKATHIEVECPSANGALAAQVLMNLENCKDIEYLILNGAKVINWGSCNVKHLSLEGIPFVERNGSKIEDLYFAKASIDLSVIPQGIKKLWLGHWRSETTEILCSQPINFPELKSLRCVGSTVKSLHHFKNCQNLENVFISGRHNDLDTDWVPNSTKRLEIRGINKFVGTPIEINKLILDCRTLDDAEEFIAVIKPKELIVEWSFGYSIAKERIVLFFEKFEDLETICIGPFLISGTVQQGEYPNTVLVGVQGYFYIFKSKMEQRRGISIEEFNALKAM